MSFDHLLALVNHVPLAALDALSRDVWRGIGEGALTETQAQALAEAIHGRRRPHQQTTTVSLGSLQVVPSQIALKTAQQASSAKPPRLWSYFPDKNSAKAPQRSPDKVKSLERRRTLASSGPLPPKLACKFTTGELAVLKVVADEFVVERQCTLSIREIAARAGLGETKTRVSLRIAQSLGLVSITERRVKYRPNLTNIVRIVCLSWLAWVARWKPRNRISEEIKTETSSPVRVSGENKRPIIRSSSGSLSSGGFTFEKATESKVYEKGLLTDAKPKNGGKSQCFPSRKIGSGSERLRSEHEQAKRQCDQGSVAQPKRA